eukprot:scaffold647901_cov35-Prasinocladus_malaysianus.AAC.2
MLRKIEGPCVSTCMRTRSHGPLALTKEIHGYSLLGVEERDCNAVVTLCQAVVQPCTVLPNGAAKKMPYGYDYTSAHLHLHLIDSLGPAARVRTSNFEQPE